MKKNVAHFALLSWMILGLLSAPAYSADALVVNLRGTAIAQQLTVPDIDGDDNEDPALCFDVDLVDPRRGSVVGSATDCLSNVEFLGGPDTPIEEQEVKLINTTFFHFAEGTLVQRGRVTLQPVLFPTGGATHLVGSAPELGEKNILSGDGEFSGVTGTSRLSGLVNMSRLGDGLLTLDCLFVLDLDSQVDALDHEQKVTENNELLEKINTLVRRLASARGVLRRGE